MESRNNAAADREITPTRHQLLRRLEGRLGHEFADLKWLHQALVHSSYAHECPEAGPSNERLEFLGDAVLSLVISDMLLAIFPQDTEGQLSHRRAALVNARQLAALARELALGDYLLLGKGEERQAGRGKASVLADALEAVLASIYLDGGLEAARAVIAELFRSRLEQAGQRRSLGDFKTLLQEYTLKRFAEMPAYHLAGESGPPHARIFAMEVQWHGRTLARGQGRTKKAAAQEAARLALEYFEGRDEEPSRISTEGQ